MKYILILSLLLASCGPAADKRRLENIITNNNTKTNRFVVGKTGDNRYDSGLAHYFLFDSQTGRMYISKNNGGVCELNQNPLSNYIAPSNLNFNVRF